jgi:hypothetical protein
MSESFLNDSFELPITENETSTSYSLLFDKAKHNFSTSSEISFIKHDLSSTKELSTTMIENSLIEEKNPFLLLFEKDDEQSTVSIDKDLFLRK